MMSDGLRKLLVRERLRELEQGSLSLAAEIQEVLDGDHDCRRVGNSWECPCFEKGYEEASSEGGSPFGTAWDPNE